jgi:hypothetical protein
MKTINLAYLAGVLDSDGSFSVIKRNFAESHANYNAAIQLSWKRSDLSLEFINMLAEHFGGSVSTCKSTNTNKSFPNTGDYVKYHTVGKSAEKLAQAVLPFLCLKKQQAQNLIDLIEITSAFKGQKQKLVTPLLHSLYLLNKSLNTKNGWKNA